MITKWYSYSYLFVHIGHMLQYAVLYEHLSPLRDLCKLLQNIVLLAERLKTNADMMW
jgi:hypothetical protein